MLGESSNLNRATMNPSQGSVQTLDALMMQEIKHKTLSRFSGFANRSYWLFFLELSLMRSFNTSFTGISKISRKRFNNSVPFSVIE